MLSSQHISALSLPMSSSVPTNIYQNTDCVYDLCSTFKTPLAAAATPLGACSGIVCSDDTEVDKSRKRKSTFSGSTTSQSRAFSRQARYIYSG
jgi:hypothetical protein